VDVVGAVYALHLLGVERVVCSPLPTGRGFVKCAHGLMPIPPPATLELLRGCALRPVDVEAELVTPTGAALAATLAESFGGLPGFTVRHVGIGAGKKDLPFPNVLRVVLGGEPSVGGAKAAGSATGSREATEVVLIEANIDDQSPQLYAGAMEALLEAGALDVWLTPIQMKKGRPAQTLSVLCEAGAREKLTGIVFAETTTLGVRYSSWERVCLEREWVEVPTPYGQVRVKVGRQDGALRTATPEYEDCRRAAAEAKVPVKLVQAAAAAAAWERLHPRTK
jgi:pyridinium-3,5-bisthiocarboxylic acid mononucleotide nickel chelatase